MQCKGPPFPNSSIGHDDLRAFHFTSRAVFPGQVLLSVLLLLYTTAIVPFQICFWNYDDPCHAFPTLYFDVIVDCFFMVPRASAAVHCIDGRVTIAIVSSSSR